MKQEPEHNARSPEELSDNEMRGGIKLGVVRYILFWGLVAAAILMGLAYLIR